MSAHSASSASILNAGGHSGVVASLKAAVVGYRDAAAKRVAVRRAIAELSALDDATLADLGIHRSQIVSLATGAARRKG